MNKLLLLLVIACPLAFAQSSGSTIQSLLVKQAPSGNCSNYNEKRIVPTVNPPTEWLCVNPNPGVNAFGTWIQSNLGAASGCVTTGSTLVVGDGVGGCGATSLAPAAVLTTTNTVTVTGKSISSGQITGLAASATTDTTNGSNISSGTVANARLAAVNLGVTGNGGVTGALPNGNLANPATTVNGQTCTLGATCTVTATPAGLPTTAVIGSTGGGTAIDISGSVIQVSSKSVQRDLKSPNDPPYNAIGDGQENTGCTTTVSGGAGGLSSVTCPGVTFTSGKAIVVFQAGVANTSFAAAVRAFKDISTTISSVTGSGAGNTANLTAAITTASSGAAIVRWGTDDQTAVAAWALAGGNLNAGPKMYLHSGIIVFPSDTNVYCNNTVFQATTNANQALVATNASNITINNCTIDGIQQGRSAGFLASGIQFSSVTNGWSINNNFHNFSEVGFISTGPNPAGATSASGPNHWRGGSVEGTMANGSLFTHGDAGSDAIGVNCVNLGDACIEATTYGSANPAGTDLIQVTNFTANGNTGNNLVAGCLLDASMHSVCINNTFINIVTFCVASISDSFSTPYVPIDTKLDGNHCTNSDSGAAGVYPAIELEGNVGVQVHNNYVEGGGSQGILQLALAAQASGASIQGNHIRGTAKNPILIQGNSDNCTIKDNFIDAASLATAGPGIVLSNSTAGVSNCTVSGNRLSNINVGNQVNSAIDVSSGLNIQGASNTVGIPTGNWSAPVRCASCVNSQVSLAPANTLTLATPSAPTGAATGGSGTNYTYNVQSYLPDHTFSIPSSNLVVSGGATLGGGVFNTITPAACQANAMYQGVRRVSGGGLSTGIIGYVACGGNIVDNGLPGDGFTAPSAPTAGVITANGFNTNDSGTAPAGLHTRGSGNMGLQTDGADRIILFSTGAIQLVTAPLTSAGLPSFVTPTLASATTVALTSQIEFVTGTTPIATMTAPSNCVTNGTDCMVTLISDPATGPYTMTTAGNIFATFTATIGQASQFIYHPATTKWYQVH